MTTPNVFVKVGTTMARVKPEHVEATRLLLERASKIPTPKQAHAKALKGGVSRKYPKFEAGQSTARYVREFHMLNARMTGGSIVYGPRLSVTDILREEAHIKDFFEPLSTLPQFAQSDEVIEEEFTA
jgi:hypothetical protein